METAEIDLSQYGLDKEVPEFKTERGLREKIGDTASKVAELTYLAITSEKAKTAYRFILEKTYYRHTATLLLLEATAISTFSHMQNPDAPILNSLYALPIGISAFKWLEGKIRTPKSTDRELAFAGKHMRVFEQIFYDLQTRNLSDGYTVHPGDRVGMLTLDKDVPIMKPEENTAVFARKLIKETENCLKELAIKCEKQDPALDGINAFFGLSLLATGPLAKKFGFNSFNIEDPFRKAWAHYKSHDIAKDVAGKNDMWERAQKQPREVQEVYISRSELVRLFGSNTVGIPETQQIPA